MSTTTATVAVAVFPARSRAVTATVFVPSRRVTPSRRNVESETEAEPPSTRTASRFASETVPMTAVLSDPSSWPALGEVIESRGGIVSRTTRSVEVPTFPALSTALRAIAFGPSVMARADSEKEPPESVEGLPPTVTPVVSELTFPETTIGVVFVTVPSAGRRSENAGGTVSTVNETAAAEEFPAPSRAVTSTR